MTVEVKGDTEDEGDEAFRLALSNLAATGDRAVLRGESTVATIVDDDPRRSRRRPPSDTVAPQTTATADPAPNAAGWHRQNVTVTLAATDAGSGVKEISLPADRRADGAEDRRGRLGGRSRSRPRA